MKNILLKTLVLSLLTIGIVTAQAQVTYDLVINNGRVMDPETMYDAIANVGITNGKIATITKEKIEGKEVIDAEGLVVAPGFIDTHFHGVDVFASKLALRDGTTTGMDLENGSSSVGAWYDKKEKTGWQLNYGTTTSLIINRLLVHDSEVTVGEPIDYSNTNKYVNESAKDSVPGWSVTRSNIAQMNEILKLVDEDLRQGAIGLGVPAAYMATGLTSYELFAAQRVVARYGRLTSCHTRFHLSSETPTEAQLGFDEIFANAYLLDAPLLMAHDNDYGWWEIEEKLKIARSKGLNMWAEYYPYAAGSTVISALFLQPETWEGKYNYVYEETIYDPLQDKFLTKEAYLKLSAENPGNPVVVFFPPRKEWIKYWPTMPHMTVATDAMPGVGTGGKLLPWDADYSEFAGHPRTAGAKAKVLRIGREQGVPLMFSVAQLSYWSALHMGEAGLEDMKMRGRIQVGKIADLTLFDPLTVTDNATYKAGENGLPSTGIPYVIVNGVVVVKDSKVLEDVKPGQPIRYPVEDKGRFEPINEKKWINENTLFVQPLEDLDMSDLDDVYDKN